MSNPFARLALLPAVLFACASFVPPRAAAQPPAESGADRTLAPYFVVGNAEPGVDALPLKATRVDVQVSGVIADVRVVQTYRNEGTVPIEARYVFPASTRAAVYALRMRVAERVVDAEIREKRQARREFDAARREGKRASLLEQHRPNVLQMSIANVMPGETIAVDLRYTETIVPDEGVYRFVFPTVVGPRYNGGTGADGTPTESRRGEAWIAQPTLRKGEVARHTFALNATLVAPFPIKAIGSPSHPFAIEGVGTPRASAKLDADGAHADRDVVLEYRLAAESIEAGVLVHEGPDENFFLALIEPPARAAPDDIVPREYVFVVDVSGSMHGFPLAVAKTLLRNLIGGLRPSDTFNVIPFAGGHSLLAPASLPATPDNIRRAIRFIDGQTGGGGTELLPALRRALALPADTGRARTFVVVTDGYVTIEKEAFELVRTNLGRANLFAFGIGASVNRHLIEGLARTGKGEPFFVLNPQQADVEATRLRRMIEAPVLTRIRARFEGFDAYELDAPGIPDLFAQRPLVLIGKFRGKPEGTIEIEGLAAGAAVRLPLQVARTARSAEETKALKFLWARSRVAQLADLQKLGEDDAIRREILALGLKYSLLTDYTSFIAVDKAIVNRGGAATAVDQPQPLPEGVEETALAAVPSTPEPEFAALAALAGALAWWMRRRRTAVAKEAGRE
ncbi:MAG: VIT and vWA domain-containing protein [Pseudomonadota bacterium]